MGYITENEPYEDRTIPEDTIFRARLSELKSIDKEWDDRTTGAKKSGVLLQWWWEITAEGKYKGRKIKDECWAVMNMDPANKYRNLAETLLNRQIPPGRKIDTDDLVGLSADISVKHEYGSGKYEGRVFERLDEVLPISGDAFALSEDPPF